MGDIRIEKSSRGGFLVYGPEQHDYGRQHLGWIQPEGTAFAASGSDGRAPDHKVDLGTHSTRKAAARAIEAWAEDNLTPAALEREFEPTTEGGLQVRFLRRVPSAIVASVQGKDRRWMTTSWNEDGICELYADDATGSERHAIGQTLRLVRREPVAEPDAPGISTP